MTFSSVQDQATERRKTLDKALRVLTENYPSPSLGECTAMRQFKQIVNDFFLTDHVEEEQSHQGIPADAPVASIKTKSPKKSPSPKRAKSPKSPPALVRSTSKEKELNTISHAKDVSTSTSPEDSTSARVQPKSIKKRAPINARKSVELELMNSKSLTFRDDDGSTIKKEESKWDSPSAVFGILFCLTMFFLWLPRVSIVVNLDVAAVAAFTCVIIGMNFAPAPVETPYEPHRDRRTPFQNRQRVDSETLIRTSMGRATPSDRSSRATMLSRSIFSSVVGVSSDNFDDSSGKSPLLKFPDDAEIGSILNCWSEPIANEFKVRGKNYLKDKVKIASGSFLFPARGADIFLSDCCPEHIAR
jgi:hypothetical protein